MGHFCRDCPLDARQKLEGSVSGDWENPLSNRGACPAEEYSRGPQFRNRVASESQHIRMIRMLTPDRCARTETPPVDGCTTEQTTPKSGFDPLVVELRSCMKSKRKRSGLKVRFERSPLPDLLYTEESEVTGSGMSTPHAGVQSARCIQVRNFLSTLGALMSWTTMERTRWGLFNVRDVKKLRVRSES